MANEKPQPLSDTSAALHAENGQKRTWTEEVEELVSRVKHLAAEG